MTVCENRFVLSVYIKLRPHVYFQLICLEVWSCESWFVFTTIWKRESSHSLTVPRFFLWSRSSWCLTKLDFRDADPRSTRRDLPILFCCNMLVALSRLDETESEAEHSDGNGSQYSKQLPPMFRNYCTRPVYRFIAKALLEFKYVQNNPSGRTRPWGLLSL
jgi:hypothetical protein